MLYTNIFQCSFVTRFDGNKNDTSTHRRTYANMLYLCFQVKRRWIRFQFHFSSPRYERTYIRLHVVSCKMRKVFFYLFVVETFFYEEAFLGRKFVRSTLNFPCQMKGGNHLTLLTSKNLHSHVNLTQNLFIFPPHIFYYCAGWLAGFFLYHSTQRKKNQLQGQWISC